MNFSEEKMEQFLAIGTKLDNFCLRDPRILDWSSRRWRVLEEIIQHRPDVITLQEVDHYTFLAPALASVGYCGRSEEMVIEVKTLLLYLYYVVGLSRSLTLRVNTSRIITVPTVSRFSTRNQNSSRSARITKSWRLGARRPTRWRWP